MEELQGREVLEEECGTWEGLGRKVRTQIVTGERGGVRTGVWGALTRDPESAEQAV